MQSVSCWNRLFRLMWECLCTGETDASCSLTLHKYVEEFPGLIHFIYVDRTVGRFLAPDMADCADMLAPDTVRFKIAYHMDFNMFNPQQL